MQSFVTAMKIYPSVLQEKISTKIIGAVNEVTDPALGVPNLSNQCTTCGGKCWRACEGALET